VEEFGHDKDLSSAAVRLVDSCKPSCWLVDERVEARAALGAVPA